MIKKIIIVFWVSLFSINSNANRTISYFEFIKELNNNSGGYKLDNVIVNFYTGDSDSLASLRNGNQPIVIYGKTELNNVKFNELKTIVFQNYSFEQTVQINQCFLGNLIFEHCFFKKGLLVSESTFGNFTLESSSIINRLELLFNNVNGNIVFSHSTFEFNNLKPDLLPLIQILKNEPAVNLFKINDCKFRNKNESNLSNAFLNLSNSEFGSVHWVNSDFDVSIITQNTIINKEFISINSTFEHLFETNGLQFPSENFNFNWEQLANYKLSTVYEEQNNEVKLLNISPEFFSLYDSTHLNQYLKTARSKYLKFFNGYRFQKDFHSASECFSEYKNLEISHYRFAISNYHIPFFQKIIYYIKIIFNYGMGITSDFGTNPIQVVISIMVVILVFSFLFFIFYSDKYSSFKIRFFENLEMYSRYFSSNKSLKQLLFEYHIDKKTNHAREDFTDYLEANKREIPFYFRFFTFSVFAYIINWYRTIFYRLLKSISFLDGKWSSLNWSKRILKNILVIILLIQFLVKVFLMRLFRSGLLSVNSLLTFGFGKMENRGGILLLTITEGVAGWYLLSMFIVSMLFQLLS